ncbi:probable helicase senataxin [Aricia agestis]|uniref:probable helicase senataxin n=1 Tax=Aricia agestis TaxID=91739 RepID=UPI001C205FBE|nr:probable helicase senataxin [Aricia agestis]XP_041987281.1 probable helicase senataxin [Aricia agestis]XP_041987282.1 probable helicase senataxin [Aricia agestis]
MARWKLLRQDYGNEEYEFFEGNEVSVGRDPSNTIALKSLVISRNHCLINFKKDEVLITDLKSANGVYVGKHKITPNVPFSVNDSDIIGFGWTYGVQGNIQDNQKYMYKLIKDRKLAEKIKFEKLDELEIIEAEIENLKKGKSSHQRSRSPVLETRQPLKRKLQHKSKDNKENISSKTNETKWYREEGSIVVISDYEGDENKKEVEGVCAKKIKSEPDVDDNACLSTKIDNEKNENFGYEAFDIKQEYLGYDDEAIVIESDEDSESEKWFMRLSQSSPGKPFEKIKERLKTPRKDSSYSQLEDFFFDDDDPGKKQRSESDEDEIMDDLITIPQSPPDDNRTEVDSSLNLLTEQVRIPLVEDRTDLGKDSVPTDIRAEAVSAALSTNDVKKIQIIEPLEQQGRRKTHTGAESKTKTSLKSTHHSRSKKSSKRSSSTRRSISNSQKEERKKRLKDLANKGKDETKSDKNKDNANKPIINVKVTSSNRGAFLTNEDISVMPVAKKDTSTKHKHHAESHSHEAQRKDESSKVNKLKKNELPKSKSSPHSVSSPRNETQQDQRKSQSATKNEKLGKAYEQSKKPVSVVEPSPREPMKKKVRFSDTLHTIHEFEIEPGNRMKKTSSAKTALLDRVPKMPVYSLKNVILMKILRWNSQWLSEQANIVEPPPILGHSNLPLALFHSFESHEQYVGMVGDLLLMEIWECLSQAYLKERDNNNTIPFQIESLPPVPPQERYFELININVNVSFPSSNTKLLPRVGEILTIEFGPENNKTCRFFYVHNIRTLPSPPNNKFSYFSISLHGIFTEKMKFLRTGELMKGKKLAYINKELSLFEAMENLARSDLCEAILKPEPYHFPSIPNNPSPEILNESKWTMNLNPSQKLAVWSSVSAALGHKPSIQMVQGPPGTGKSSVICAMVMSYMYGASGARLANRGKILICATSNAAVDELVIRLLNIRKDLTDRFRLVRVGRWEAMNARARTVSSQELAQRDARAHAPTHSAALDTEIAYQIAKINMWNTNLREAKDPERVAYCQGKVTHYTTRLTMLQSGGGGGVSGAEPRRDQLQQSERRIIECADVVVTTLSSAISPKMKGIKERVALCIVDEAGQAIEPEALVPLTLGVARLTLVGDPQQLPGYICSQRAKKHGLGESLFSRLSSVAELWERSPVVLLDRQYRMHPAIADYPNRAFYGGRIQTPPRGPPADLPVPPYCVVDVASGDRGQAASGANETEAWGVARVASALAVAVRARRLSVAVITPYAAQRDMLLRCLRDLNDGRPVDIEVNTVDSFQGQERDVVLVSLARSQGAGFIADAGRMCVMLTRAKHALIVCLNPMALVRNQQWRTLIEDAQRRKVFTCLPKRITASAESIPNEQILECITKLKPKSLHTLDQ